MLMLISVNVNLHSANADPDLKLSGACIPMNIQLSVSSSFWV